MRQGDAVKYFQFRLVFCGIIGATTALSGVTVGANLKGISGTIKKEWKTKIQSLMEGLQNEGINTPLGNMAKELKLPPDVIAKSKWVVEEESADGFGHSTEIILRKQAKNVSWKPYCLVFNNRQKFGDYSLAYYFVANLDGSINRIFLLKAKYDLQGKVIRSSGVVESKDANDLAMKERYEHELDFWLEGKFRKPKPLAVTQSK